MRYAIVIEQTGNNYSAYASEFPGCVATGSSVVETEGVMRDAINFHLEGSARIALPFCVRPRCHPRLLKFKLLAQKENSRSTCRVLRLKRRGDY